MADEWMERYMEFEVTESRLLDHWYAPVVAKKAFEAGYRAAQTSPGETPNAPHLQADQLSKENK
jgi:hypothetical protein